MKRLLIIFTRYPRPGSVKTRLIPALGAGAAADLHRQLTESTLRTGRAWKTTASACIAIGFSGGTRLSMRTWLGPGVRYRPQRGKDLGARMGEAFQVGFRAGHQRIVLIGTDCPELNVRHLQEAFKALDHRDVVLGPARDGGYYLIGMSRFCPALLQGIAWGTDRVLRQTQAAIKAAGLSAMLLEPLHDLDTHADLAVWERVGGSPRHVSVIIPTFNEAQHIGDTVESARLGGALEVLVVDGGSTDGTAERARRQGARVLASPRGRAVQMNAGAAEARGDCLLFLHADVRLPEDYALHVRRVLSDQRTALGAFQFHIQDAFVGRRWIEVATRFRATALQMPYGDQALFVRHRDFREAGGYRELPIMEDYEFVRRLRRVGRIVIAPAPVMISARRWQALGALRTTLVNQIMIAGYHLGIHPDRLATWYRGTRSPPKNWDQRASEVTGTVGS